MKTPLRSASLLLIGTLCAPYAVQAAPQPIVPPEKETPKALYPIACYRITGERAVRYDNLERHAELIRPAISWPAGTRPSTGRRTARRTRRWPASGRT